jgi:hypothetical protein
MFGKPNNLKATRRVIDTIEQPKYTLYGIW